jgi:putative MATE family efflux protein
VNPTPKKREIDMCTGPLVPKIMKFSVPLMLSGLLQLSFSTVNMIVVGQFRGSDGLAAIGATFNLTELLLFAFMGLAVGANVLVARYIGAKDEKGVKATVHTAIAASIIGGIIFGISGFLLCLPLLRATGTPDNIIGQSALYMRIYFTGLPVITLYNFGSAILRAAGDTKSPLYFLGIAGVLNVALTLMFVLVFGSGVSGVSLANVLSQALAAGLVLRRLMKSNAVYAVRLKSLRIDWQKLGMIARIGVPEGLQGMMFAIANVLIQSSINSFGDIAIAGNAAAIFIEGFIFAIISALPQAAIAFTGQNMGAQNFKIINRIYFFCCAITVVFSAVMCTAMILLRVPLVSIFSSAPEVIAFAALRILILGPGYVLNMITSVTCGVMRGMGSSLLPAVVCLLGICVFRVIWIETIFPVYRTFAALMLTYPASWIITLAATIVCFVIVKRRIIGKALENEAALQAS